MAQFHPFKSVYAVRKTPINPKKDETLNDKRIQNMLEF